MPDRFFAPDFVAGNRQHILEGDEHHHLRTVLRLRPGQDVELFDGRGGWAKAGIASVERNQTVLDMVETGVDGPSRPAIVIACAVPKGDRAPFMVEKCTELGAQKIVLLTTERSVVDPGEGKIGRLRRTVIEACKQCGRNRLLDIDGPTPWTDFLADQRQPGWLLDPSGDESLSLFSNQPHVVAVGPEGGWTEPERASAAANGWRLVRLGEHILRIESAVIAAAALGLAAR